MNVSLVKMGWCIKLFSKNMYMQNEADEQRDLVDQSQQHNKWNM